MNEMNKRVIRKIFEHMNKHDFSAVFDELYANCVYYSPALGELKGEALRKFITSAFVAFPDAHWAIGDQIAEGDKVVTLWTMVGTHKGEFMGIAPTNKKFVTSGITIDHLVNGKIVEEREEWDALGMMRQLGVVPEAKIAKPAAA